MSQKTPLVLSGAQLQQLQASDYANIGIPFFMFKNRILNGDFNIWQRGTALNTITASGSYYPDQWVYTFDGTTPYVNVQQEAFSVGQTAVPDSPLYYCECSASGSVPSGQTFSRMSQRIEGVQTFQGQSVTVSFWAKADTSRSLSVSLNQNFGTGGSPSTTVSTSGTTFTLSTSWTKYTYTFSVPSISGKTLGTGGNDYLELVFGLPINSAFTIDIAHVQLEQGSNATQFEYRKVSHELLMAQRYYCRCGAGACGCFFSSSGCQLGFSLPTAMRAVPTCGLTTSSPAVTVPGTNTYTASSASMGFNNAPIPNVTTMVNVLISGFTGATTKQPAFLNDNYCTFSAEL